MLPSGDQIRSVEFEQRVRTYLVHVPPGYDPSRPTPVVLAFHGGGTNAKTMVRFCGLSETADRDGFLAVYPNGSGRNPNWLTWNAGDCCAYAMRQNVDDVGFVGALLDDLSGVAHVDPKRVFATGMSNGGMLAYRLASELSQRIAAIASVSGPMGTDARRPTRPVSVLHFHGTSDEFAPYAGGRGAKSFTQSVFRSVDFSIRNWIRANECPAKGEETGIPQKNQDGISVTRTTWGPGKKNSEVVLFTIHGAGHTWPGRVPPTPFLGAATTEVSANDVMWEFFTKHPMER
jgi:polyhydroxybutyrate depolymerase